MTATKSEAENVASVVTFTAFYQDIPALSISWLSPFPSVMEPQRTQRSRREFHAGPSQTSIPIRNRLIPSVNCRTLKLIRRPTGFSVFFSQ